MTAVRGNPWIFLLQCGLHTTCYRLLSVIQMAESADIFSLMIGSYTISDIKWIGKKRDYRKRWQTLYSVSLEISTLRMVYISLKKARSSSFVTVTVVEGASHTVIVKNRLFVCFQCRQEDSWTYGELRRLRRGRSWGYWWKNLIQHEGETAFQLPAFVLTASI